MSTRSTAALLGGMNRGDASGPGPSLTCSGRSPLTDPLASGERALAVVRLALAEVRRAAGMPAAGEAVARNAADLPPPIRSELDAGGRAVTLNHQGGAVVLAPRDNPGGRY